MKRKSIATLAIASVAMLASCKKDDLNISPQPFPARIEKITMDDDLVKLTYDAGGRVNTITVNDEFGSGSTPVQYSVQYDASNHVTSLQAGNNTIITPLYENDELRKVVAKNAANETIYETDYLYLNGFLKSADVKVNDGTGVLVNSLRFLFSYDAAGNVIKNQVFMGNIWGTDWVYTGSHEYTYDNKINPLKNLKSILLMLLQNVSPNNVLVDKGLDASGTETERQTFSYTYNSSNFPVSATVQISESGSTPVSKQLNFTYKP